MPCNAKCVNYVAFIHVMVFTHQLGDIAIGFFHRNRQFATEPLNKRFAHNAHESGIPHGAATLLLIQSDLPLVKLLVAMFTKSQKIIGRVGSCLPALQMMHMELDALLCGRMRPTALAGVIIALEDILANVVFVVHLAELIIYTNRQRTPLQHSFQPLSIELGCLNDHFGDRKQGTHTLDGSDVLLHLHFYRRGEPTLMLASNTVIKSWCAVSGFAVSFCPAELPAGRKQIHNIVAWLDFRCKEFPFLGGSAQPYGFRTCVNTESDRLLVTAAAMQQLDGEWCSLLYSCLPGIQKASCFSR